MALVGDLLIRFDTVRVALDSVKMFCGASKYTTHSKIPFLSGFKSDRLGQVFRQA